MAIETLPFTVTLTGNGGTYYPTDFSFQWPLNGAITWSATLGEMIDIDFADDAQWHLIDLCGTMVSEWPPLVASVPKLSEGIGIGEKTAINGTDLYSYLLSKDGTDLPTYTETWSDTIVRALAAHCGVQVYGDVPHYKIEEFDVQEGKPIEHISRILRDGGCGFKVYRDGLMVMGLKESSDSGLGNNWIKTAERTRNMQDKITSIKIAKTSKIQTHYEFSFQDSGKNRYPQKVDFSAPMESVIFDDASLIGWIDEIAYFNEPGCGGQQVGAVYITKPQNHPGMTYPVGSGAPPIKSASLACYPMEDGTSPVLESLGEIYCVAVFDGIPQRSSWYDDIDLSFDSTYDTDETPSRPAAECIDGSLMPNKAHADSIIEALFFDRNKGSHKMDFAADDPIPLLEPGEVVPWRSNNGRIETVNVSKSGLQVNCCKI